MLSQRLGDALFIDNQMHCVKLLQFTGKQSHKLGDLDIPFYVVREDYSTCKIWALL